MNWKKRTRERELAGDRARHQNELVHASAAIPSRIAPSASTASAVAATLVYECDHDVPRVSIPRPETHLVVRFGPGTHSGLDAHALGVRQTVRRKLVHGGQRIIMARLHLGVTEAVFGVPAAAMAERIVALEELWGEAATRRLLDQLANARDTLAAAVILERTIAERHQSADARRAPVQLAIDAARKLTRAAVNTVAVDLGVSERHLRRIFRETLGVSPKAFTKLLRFERAVRAAREDDHPSWASIAASAGYYDQAHLIAEFRAIAGVTPRTLLSELRADPSPS
jgi:AraC-like DNA-binding protein